MNSLKSLWQHRELLRNMVEREIKARYKQSILGYGWVILNPFFQMLVMTFVFSIIIKIPTWGIPYPIFLYAGLLPWTFFVNSISSSTNSLVSAGSLITKVYFPREIFPIATTIAKIIDLILASTVFALFMIIFQQPVTWAILWILPIFIVQFFFTLGISFLTSAFNLFYRDIQYLMTLILMLWMYVTPVIYPVDIVPARFRFVFALNPMSVLINAYRQSILGGTAPNLTHLGIAAGVSGIIFLLGYIIFKRLEPIFADVI